MADGSRSRRGRIRAEEGYARCCQSPQARRQFRRSQPTSVKRGRLSLSAVVRGGPTPRFRESVAHPLHAVFAMWKSKFSKVTFFKWRSMYR
jgi:hypothetical protein